MFILYLYECYGFAVNLKTYLVTLFSNPMNYYFFLITSKLSMMVMVGKGSYACWIVTQCQLAVDK